MEKKVAINSDSAPPPMVPVHKDINNITIKKGSSNNGSSYELSYNGNDSNFQQPAGDSFITHGAVAKLTEDIPKAQDNWVLYFNTKVPVESANAQISYTITLSDKKGVVSDSVTKDLEKKFKVEFEADGGSPAPNTQYIKTGGKVTEPSPPPTKAGHTLDGWFTAPTESSTQWDFDNHTVTQDITLYAKWTESSDTPYTVKHYQQNIADNYYPSSYTDRDNTSGTTGALLSAGNGITLRNYPGFEFDKLEPDSPTIAADGNTVVKVYYKRKTYNVNFSVNGSNGSITATNVIGGFVTGSSVTVKHGGSITFTAHPDTGYEVDSWTGATANMPNTTATLTVTAPVSVTVSFRQKTYTVTYSVAGGQGTIQADSDTPTTSSNTKQVVQGGSVTFTARPDTGWEVDSWTGATATPPNNTTATLSGVTAATTVTVTFKKTYTVTFKVDGGHGSLNGAYNGSENTAAGSGQETFTVLDGGSVTFTAQPDGGYEVDSWTGATATPPHNTTATLTVTANTTVTVKFKPGTIELKGGLYAWSRLIAEASGADGAGTIIIDGEIKAGSTFGDFGEIKPGRNLTIKGKNASAVLNADGKSRIFHLQGGPGNGKTLILENITLKNGFLPSGASKEGGGVLIKNYNTLIMKNAQIIDCTAWSNGGGVCVHGHFKMQGSSTITGCQTTRGQGGGVYGSVEMQGGALVTPASDKNDVFLNFDDKITVTGALTHTPAARITPNSYHEDRVVVQGPAAKKANFTVTPNGGETWHLKKVGNELKLKKD